MAPRRVPQGVRGGVRRPLLTPAVFTAGCSPSPRAQDVVLVHRRTCRRFDDVDATLGGCGVGDGDGLELTIRFAAESVADRFMEPVGFYAVEPRPASKNVPTNAVVRVHLVNVLVDDRPCVSLRPMSALGGDEGAVPCRETWEAPNVLKLVPLAPLQATTLYAVTLDLTLTAPGMRVLSDWNDVSCVADGVDTVRPYLFVWSFETGARENATASGATEQAADLQPHDQEESLVDIVEDMLSRPLDGFSKRQLLGVQASLRCMMDRVGNAITHIDHKIDTINRRLQEKSRRLNGEDRAQPAIEQALKKLRQS